MPSIVGDGNFLFCCEWFCDLHMVYCGCKLRYVSQGRLMLYVSVATVRMGTVMKLCNRSLYESV